MSGQVEALEMANLIHGAYRGRCGGADAGCFAAADAVLDWLRDHDRALRESIAADIEAHSACHEVSASRETRLVTWSCGITSPNARTYGEYHAAHNAAVARGEQP